MPKDNRNTLAAFDDLLSSLEGVADDILEGSSTDFGMSSGPAPGPSTIDNEFYDFYFEMNNVPRKASAASITPPNPPISQSSTTSKTNYNPAPPVDLTSNEQLPSSTLSADLYIPPPPPPVVAKSSPVAPHHIPPRPLNPPPSTPSKTAKGASAPPNPPSSSSPTLYRNSTAPPPVPEIQRPQVGGKPTAPSSTVRKSLAKAPPKPHVNKSNLSLKKTAKGPAVRLNPPSGTPAAPYEAPQRFLSRGSYGTGATKADSSFLAPPLPKEVPQRFMSTGSYLPSPASPPPTTAKSPPAVYSPTVNEPPQRFYSTNSFASRPQPSLNRSDGPQRFMSTNSFVTNRNDGDPQLRAPFIGNRPPSVRNLPDLHPPQQTFNPPLSRSSELPTPPRLHEAPAQSYNSPIQSQRPPPQAQLPFQSYTPPLPPSQPNLAQLRFHDPPANSKPYSPTPQSYTQPRSYEPPTQSYSPTPSPRSQPPQTFNTPREPAYAEPPSYSPSSRSYTPSPGGSDSQDADREGDRRSNRIRTVNSRKSVRMPKAEGQKGLNHVCGKCGSVIEGEYIMALNQFWCPDHFSCGECDRPLHGVFSEENGRPFCSDCMGNKHLCVTCGRGVVSGQFYVTEHGRRHAECMPLVLCDICNNPIKPGTPKMKALDKTFHPECFRCMTCDRLIHGEFTNRNGRPLCVQCSQTSQPKCARCNNNVTGQYVSYDSKRFHYECFQCNRCSARLSMDAFYTNSDQTYCERCIHSVLSGN